MYHSLCRRLAETENAACFFCCIRHGFVIIHIYSGEPLLPFVELAQMHFRRNYFSKCNIATFFYCSLSSAILLTAQRISLKGSWEKTNKYTS